MCPPEADAEPSPRTVVLRALGLGDLCTSVAALRGLRRAHREHRLLLAGPASLAPLAELSGAVDGVVDVTTLDAGPLPPSLCGAELAVNLHGRGPQSSELLTAASSRRLVAFAHPDVPATGGGPAWDDDEHEVERWCRLVARAGAHADPTDLLLPLPQRLADDASTVSELDVIVHPGAASQARRWPADRWASVVGVLVAAGRHVTITGGPDEVALADEIVERQSGSDRQARRCVAVAGRTEVLDLAGLVAAANLLVAGDTGIAHMATAFATPSVLLFGPTSPARWGPITGGPHRVLWAGRTGDPHADVPDPGLLEITVADVLKAIGEAPAATGELRPACDRAGVGWTR